MEATEAQHSKSKKKKSFFSRAGEQHTFRARHVSLLSHTSSFWMELLKSTSRSSCSTASIKLCSLVSLFLNALWTSWLIRAWTCGHTQMQVTNMGGGAKGRAAHITVCANVTLHWKPFPVLSLTSCWENLSFFSLDPEEDGAGGDLFILYTHRQTDRKSTLTHTVNTGYVALSKAKNDTSLRIQTRSNLAEQHIITQHPQQWCVSRMYTSKKALEEELTSRHFTHYITDTHHRNTFKYTLCTLLHRAEKNYGVMTGAETAAWRERGNGSAPLAKFKMPERRGERNERQSW